MRDSKPLRGVDESAKALIQESLAGDLTYGFDIDSIYYLQPEDKWIVIEFLKCDHATVRPRDSHPSRYWNMNWRKFASLWRLASKLGAVLFLVNYEDDAHAQSQGRGQREFLIIEVQSMNPSEQGGITAEKKSEALNFEGFSKWFRELNGRGKVK